MTINELTTLENWQNVWKRSMDSPVLIYKHSTTCPISSAAFEQVKAFQETEGDKIDCYMVKVIESREVSNQIAKDTAVPHKSPQILLLDKQEVVWNTSHWEVTEQHIKEAVR